jgi:hypothetical protein
LNSPHSIRFPICSFNFFTSAPLKVFVGRAFPAAQNSCFSFARAVFASARSGPLIAPRRMVVSMASFATPGSVREADNAAVLMLPLPQA